MNPFETRFWAGTEASLADFLLMQKRAAKDNLLSAEQWSSSNDAAKTNAQADAAPRLYTQMGDIGVIRIAGPLNNSDSWMNEMMGMTGYQEIRDAMVYGASDPNVKAIVLDINSGGGSVSGCADCGALISAVDAGVKPVHAFSDGGIMSAAYWLGSSARSVNIGSVTDAGSIGVIAVHQEMSRMMVDEGIGVTVLRSGKYKGMGNPYEPLSAEAKVEMQGQIDQAAQLFTQHVADARGTTYAIADQKMGQGRVFLGQAALDVGLVDSITTFDALMSKIQGGIDSSKQQPKYGANFNQGPSVKKTALTEQAIAALAAGAVLNAVEGSTLEAVDPVVVAALAAEAVNVVTASGDMTPAAIAAGAVENKPNELLAYVQGQLAESQAAVLNLSMELRDAKAAGEGMKGTHAAMRTIVGASVNQLKIALGGSAGDLALTDAQLLADHAGLRTQFESKFKAGGVAAVSSAGSADKEGEVALDPARQARIRATRINNKK